MTRIFNRGRNNGGNETRGRKGGTTYQPPQRLELPKELVDRFKAEGMGLRWIRTHVGGAEDANHIGARLQEGYVFVKPNEVEELATLLRLNINSSDGMVKNGDLALAKIPLDLQIARQEYYENMALEQEAAFMKDVERSGSRTMPVFNNSRSTTRTGRRAEFAPDEG